MATVIPEAKYHKLATEYSKLRAQARVLKKAVLEEQAKNSTIREQLRQRETSLRRSEQEVDSLGFRNMQLEHRVEALQQELAACESRKLSKEQRKGSKGSDPPPKSGNVETDMIKHDTVIFEELQKKILENAQLKSLNDDKERELQLHSNRITYLEQILEKNTTERNDMEKRLRRELDALQSRNSELETKLVEVASMLGSEDALSASESDHTPLHSTHINYSHTSVHTANTHSTESERIAFLEQEVSHWRTKYEMTNFSENTMNNNKDRLSAHQQALNECCCSTAATGLTVFPSYAENKSIRGQQMNETNVTMTKEDLLHNKFSKKFEDLLKAKCEAESRVTSYEWECQHLQRCLEDATEEVKTKEENFNSMSRTVQVLEEDLATTRINYEEQISVLTEQVISLSEQLAACK